MIRVLVLECGTEFFCLLCSQCCVVLSLRFRPDPVGRLLLDISHRSRETDVHESSLIYLVFSFLF